MGAFTGTLNQNEIFASMYNMIISQEVFADNLKHNYNLVDEARVDGSLFGDEKLYISTDALKTYAWGGDSEASNLLALNRPSNPSVQAIVLDKFRQLRVTIDNYLTKRAFMDEGAFASFNGVILGWLVETRKMFENLTYNTFIGTDRTATGNQTIALSYTLPSGVALGTEEANRLTAGFIANAIANIIDDMKDYSRKYNDYQYMRSYSEGELKFVWNAEYVNSIKLIDLPTVFHNEELKAHLVDRKLPNKYFGIVLTSSNISTYSDSTPAAGKPIDSDNGAYTPGVNHANGLVRSLVEKDVTVGGIDYHVLPGEEIPSGATVLATSGNFAYGEVFIAQDDVVCKIYAKLPPFMSAFSVGTSFFNARSLTENHYLTFGYNTLEHLKNYPAVTITLTVAEHA